MLGGFGTFLHNLPIDPYAIAIIGLLLFIVYLFHKADQLDWTDLITAKGPDNKVSLTKLLQLIGGIVGTWIMIHVTLHDKLTYDILLVYLAYVGSIEGFSKFVAAKYSSNNGVSTGLPSLPGAPFPGVPPITGPVDTTTVTVTTPAPAPTPTPTPTPAPANPCPHVDTVVP